MSKTKSSEKNHYELLYIIPNKFTTEEAAAIDEKIKKEISGFGGEITYSEDWGDKKLAYIIRGFSYGYYKLVEFDISGSELGKLDNFLRLSNDVLRHQVVRIKKRSLEDIEADKQRSENLYRIRKNQKSLPEDVKERKNQPLNKEESKGGVEEKKSDSAAEDKQVEEKKFSKKKTDLKDLDKKLDDILETDDLL
jgi:small subunit ribosomal protein S6